MNLSEAIHVILAGHRVRNSRGSEFWLEHDSKGRPVLVGQPKAYPRPVRNLVIASEHFSPEITWETVA